MLIFNTTSSCMTVIIIIIIEYHIRGFPCCRSYHNTFLPCYYHRILEYHYILMVSLIIYAYHTHINTFPSHTYVIITYTHTCLHYHCRMSLYVHTIIWLSSRRHIHTQPCRNMLQSTHHTHNLFTHRIIILLTTMLNNNMGEHVTCFININNTHTRTHTTTHNISLTYKTLEKDMKERETHTH